MRTIVCETPKQFRMIDTPLPIRGEGEALVQIRRVGICGTDLHAFRGEQPYFVYPRILGHELSGVVVEAPAASSELRPGDTVAILPYMECGECVACRRGRPNCCTQLRVLGVHIDGGMREYVSIPADHLLRTDDLSLDHAAILEPLSIGAHAVRRSRITSDDTAVVVGAGPIGLGVMAFAKRRGARVIAVDINERRLAFAKEWAHTDESIDTRSDAVGQLERLTNGDLAHVVFDATGNAKSMAASFAYAANGATVVFVGLVKDDIPIADPEFHRKEITLLASRNATREDFSTVISALREGSVNGDAYITHRSDSVNMIETFPTWLDPTSGVIKAVVEW